MSSGGSVFECKVREHEFSLVKAGKVLTVGTKAFRALEVMTMPDTWIVAEGPLCVASIDPTFRLKIFRGRLSHLLLSRKP